MSDELGLTDGAAEPGRVPDRRVLLVAGVVASLMLGGGAFLFVGGGEEPADEVVFAVPRRAVTTGAAATPTPSPSATATRQTPENPFLARVSGGTGGGGPAPAPDLPVAGDPLAQPPVPAPAQGLPTALPGIPTAAPTSAPSSPLPGVGLPTAVPTATPTATPTGTPTARPTTPAPARHTLVLTRVTGKAPALQGRFVVDSEVVTVPVGSSFGPGGLVVLQDLTQYDGRWVAVLVVGDAQPQDQPLGTVLTFSP